MLLIYNKKLKIVSDQPKSRDSRRQKIAFQDASTTTVNAWAGVSYNAGGQAQAQLPVVCSGVRSVFGLGK
ncbi:hypothetical protein [Rhizobium aegyptiacum]|uniref:hypothetical protein n=1 Tax=Rhizobium aegyptiacum TaxID=1764550 RepID=UPI0012E8823B|nr:hypothetical protein [Rhizobium aegyptiacum]